MAKVWDKLTAGVSKLTGERGQSATAGKAVKIVDLIMPDWRAVLNETEMQSIIKQADLPTVVVSIGGVARSGKSFLLNLLVNYLTYLEKHGVASRWETSNNPVQGINWAVSREAVTLGIWMWSKPFIIRRLDGKSVAVLLVDSQGTGDNRRSDPKLDTLIMYISLMLSSFQLININAYLRADELTSLQLCTDYADIDEDSPTRGQSTYCPLFDNLIFVIRNCQDTGGIYGEDPNIFLEIKKGGINAELSRAVEGIERAFKQITAFALPHPGRDIAGGGEKQKKWTLQDIPKELLDPVKELATVLFTSDRMAVEELPTGFQILKKFQALKIRLESKDLPEIGNPADALQEAILYKAFSKAYTLYTETIREVQKNLSSHKSEADLMKTLASARDVALQVFHREGHQHKYGHSTIWGKYEDMFQTQCDKQQSVLIAKLEKYYQDKKMADLVQQNQEFKRQMEKQAQENAEEFAKLKRESNAHEARYKEYMKESGKRDKALQSQLENTKEQLRTARVEDRAYYEAKMEETKKNIQQENEAKVNAERVHAAEILQQNEAKLKETEAWAEKKLQYEIRILKLEKDLMTERNKPPVEVESEEDNDDSGCSIL